MIREKRGWPLWVVGLLSALVVAGCRGESKGANSPTDAGSSYVEPALPADPGEAGKETVTGIDSDGDGVRDDLQRYIAQTFPSSARARAALRQMAKALQALVLVPAGDKNAALNAGDRIARAADCLVYAMPQGAGDASDGLEAQLTNTDARLQAYFAANALCNGGLFSGSPNASKGATCEVDLAQLPN